MPKVRESHKAGPERYFVFHCPECGHGHQFKTPMWMFNGMMDAPTVIPSILVHGEDHPGGFRCHSFITNGKIKFLNDSTHALAGKEVDLPEVGE